MTTPGTPSTQVAPPAQIAALAGKPFAISFDGSMLTGAIAIRTVKDIDRLMRVLAAQKAAFEAMQEDDGGDDLAGELDVIARGSDPPTN